MEFIFSIAAIAVLVYIVVKAFVFFFVGLVTIVQFLLWKMPVKSLSLILAGISKVVTAITAMRSLKAVITKNIDNTKTIIVFEPQACIQRDVEHTNFEVPTYIRKGSEIIW